jgi:hypothetical protein
MDKKINIAHVPKELLFIGMRIQYASFRGKQYVGHIAAVDNRFVGIKWVYCLDILYYSINNPDLYIVFEKCKKLQKIYKDNYG